MSRRLLALNVVLGLVGLLLVAGLARELLAARPLPAPPPLRIVRPAPILAPTPGNSPLPSAAYGVIAAKNLFSPTRSEAPAGPAVGAGPKPVLHGVVVDGPKSRAYLEDPLLKRTFGYAIGDTVGGGRLESISADRVVITRADGLVEVLLQDPSKPRVATPTDAVLTTPPPTAAAPRQAGPTQAATGETRPPNVPVSVGPPSTAPSPGSRLNKR